VSESESGLAAWRRCRVAVNVPESDEVVELSPRRAAALIEADARVRAEAMKFTARFGDHGRLILINPEIVRPLLEELGLAPAG
jgi:hypothetical protein